MARPGSKPGSRAKEKRKPPNNKRVKTELSEKNRGVLTDSQNLKQSPVPAMRRLFSSAQTISKVNAAVENLIKLFNNCDRDEAMTELKNCIKIAVRMESESPFWKPLSEFVCRSLLLLTKIDKEKQAANGDCDEDDEIEDEYDEEEEEFEESDESDEEADEFAMLSGSSKSSKSSARSTARSTGRKKAAKKPSKKAVKPKKKTAAKKKSADKKAVLTVLDLILRDVLVKGMADVTPNTACNCLFLVQKLMSEVEDMANNIYDLLKEELIAQLGNKNGTVRAAAVKALHRFQDINDESDVVTSAFNYHLQHDPDFKVRQAIALVIEPTDRTLDNIMLRIRDVKEIVRKSIYQKIAMQTHIKSLKFSQRMSVLKNGLNDRSPAVKRVVEKMLIVNWMRECDENVMELLHQLDIESDEKTVEQLLRFIFRSYMEQMKDDKTKLHLFVQQFKFKFLDGSKLLMKEPLNVENAFLWRSLAYFLKECDLDPLDAEVEDKDADNRLDAEIDRVFDQMTLAANRQEDQMDQSDGNQQPNGSSDADGQPGEPTPPKKTKTSQAVEVDLLDYILPQLPHFCNFIKKFTKKVDEKDFDELQLADLDFVYEQLVKILMLIEVRDEQKVMVEKMVEEIVKFDQIPVKMEDAIGPLMHFVAKNVYKTPEQLLAFTQRLTQRIHNSIYDRLEDQQMEVQNEQPTSGGHDGPLTAQEEREIDLKYARLTIKVEELADERDKLVKEENYIEAARVKEQITALEREKQQVAAQRQEIRGQVAGDTESVPSSQSQKPEPLIQDHPIELKKCLQIFSGCLESGEFRVIESIIQSHVDKICFAGLLSADSDIRRISVKILGNCCTISAQFAKKYFLLIVQVIRHDEPKVSVMAMQALIDVIAEHGISELYDAKAADKTTSPEPTSSFQVEETEAASSGEPASETGVGSTSSQLEPSQANSEIVSEVEFSDQLNDLLMDQLRSTVPAVQAVSVKGVAKLMFLSRISSPSLLCQLILIWYNPKTKAEVKVFLGNWFPIFAFSDSKVRDSSCGQVSFEESFFPLLEQAQQLQTKDESELEDWEYAITPDQIDNMIVFVCNLMSESIQIKVAIGVAHKLLTCSSDGETEINQKFLIKALCSLIVDTGTKAQLRELQVLGQKIKTRITTGDISCSKVVAKKVEQVFSRVDAILSHLKDDCNSSQLSTRDTEPDEDRTLLAEDLNEQPSSRPVSRSSAVSTPTTNDNNADDADPDSTLIDYQNLSQRRFNIESSSDEEEN